jgi:hypothetical protein
MLAATNMDTTGELDDMQTIMAQRPKKILSLGSVCLRALEWA